MTEKPYVAGVWPMGRLAADGVRLTSPEEFLVDCKAKAYEVLRAAGLLGQADALGPDNLLELAERVPRGSREDVALSLWAACARGGMHLGLARERGGAFADNVAEAFGNAGMLLFMLDGMAPQGVADMANSGAAGRRQRKNAAQRAAEVSANEGWRTDARRLWEENPTWTLNRVASTIAARHSTPTRSVHKESVMRSIRRLTPPSSPSYEAE